MHSILLWESIIMHHVLLDSLVKAMVCERHYLYEQALRSLLSIEW